MSAGVQTTVPLALGLLLDAAPAPANAGVSTTFPLVLGLLLESGSGAAATISAAYGAPTSGTTVTVGCTTDTASGTLYVLARIGGSAASAATIIATGQSVAIGSTAPSFSYTGLTAATAYTFDLVQVVASVNSNVAQASAETDNTGSGGGTIANAATGALVGGGAAVAGTAGRTRTHASPGVMAGGGAAVSGTARRMRAHATSGTLAGAGATVAGVSEISLPGVHVTTAALAGAGAVVAGVAVRRARHVTSGAMVGSGAAVSGAAATPLDATVRSAPPSGHGSPLSRRGRNLSTRTR